MTPKDLIYVDFPKCFESCELVEILGVSECENNRYCDVKINEKSCTYCNLDRHEEKNKLVDVGDGEYVCELCIKSEGIIIQK